MLTVERILFPTDMTPCAERAFSHAAHLAARYGATLFVLRVTQPHEREIMPPEELPFREFDVAEELKAATTDVATADRAPRRADEVEVVHREVVTVDAVMGILECADQEDVDLIVMGAHGRRGIDHLLVGSVAEDVARRAPAPVMTVRSPSEDRPARAVERILVPIDFSEHATIALTYARELAADYGARLDLLHVVEDAVLPVVYGIEPVAVSTQDVRSRAERALGERLARAPGADVAADVHATFGHAVTSILEAADQFESDLIVVATHGRTGLKRFFMGSIAEKVVRMAPCPVFTVKSFGKSLVDLPALEEVHRTLDA